jgi:transcriptional regulator GlxA family with amidase domain
MEIAIVLFEGFDELDAIGPYEVFENAGDAGADLTVSLCTLAETERITASHGLRVEPDATLDERSPDMVVVPGGGWNDRSEAGARAEAERGDLPDELRRRHERETTVAAVCTGGMLLARAGLLDGRPAVTHAGAVPDLRDSAARVVDARVVDDGDVLTAGGVTSGIDLAFHVVEREFGAEIAREVAEGMEYNPSDDVHTDGGR